MVCKTCGAVINEGDSVCRNCGDTIRVKENKKVALEKGITPESKFKQQAAQFGGVTVKERRSSALSGVDPKIMSIILISAIFVIFVTVVFIYDHKRTTCRFDGFEVTLPASMRSVNDNSFEVLDSDICKSYANSELEFTYVIYGAETIIPELAEQPQSNDIKALMEYYDGKDKLVTLKKDFTDELDKTFSEQLKDYECIENDNGVLKFTYNDSAMTNNYVEMHIVVVDERVYQFSVLCSDASRGKHEKTIAEIYKSLKLDK